MSDRVEQTAFERPPGATEIVLLRHGASEAAVAGVRFPLVEGRGDPALSEAGRRQASIAGERLSGEPFEALFASTLRRTQETAAPLAAATGLEPVILPELREVSLGELEGGEYRIRSARGDPLIARVFAEERWDVVPGGEAAADFADRVRSGIAKVVAATGADATAVAVVHGAVIGELCRQATDSRPFAFVHSDNCSVSRLIVNADGKWLLRSFNDISHFAPRT